MSVKKQPTISWIRWLLCGESPKVFALFVLPIFVILVFGYSLSYFNTTDLSPEFSIIDAAKQKEFGEFTVKVKTDNGSKNMLGMISTTAIRQIPLEVIYRITRNDPPKRKDAYSFMTKFMAQQRALNE